MKFCTPRLSFFVIFLLVTLFLSNLLFGQEQQEETYSISLVQTAEVDQDIREVDDKKVLTETYTVTKGDHLWQLFRDRGMLEKRSLPELIAILKRLNKTLTNLDLIYPGDQIIIPLTLLPVTSRADLPKPGPEEIIPLEDLKKINLENYTVKRGDSLVKVIKSRYDIPPKELHKKYLEMVRRLNPTIEDLDTIFPGQVIRLPIYSPQIVKVPILTPTEPPSKKTGSENDLTTLGRSLGAVFGEMGRNGVREPGKHFIPLKSGGQINLNADSYPIINLVNGNRVIVDMYHLLPDKMTALITSNWDNYKIVHLTEGDDLKKALGKILPACDYHRIHPPGGAMEVEGDIRILITADWIIEPDAAQSGNRRRVVAITVTDNHNANTPPEIKNYLKRLGITVIDYPSFNEMPPEPADKPDLLSVGISKPTLIEKLLNLSGYSFRRGVEIPVYQSNKTDFNLIIRADFLLQKDGADSIIDLTGLGPDVLSLLKEHQFRILPLGDVNDPLMAASKTLDFLEVKVDSKHHPFMVAERDNLRNIKLIIPGIIFQDQTGQTIFATELSLPPEVIVFLSRKGYRVLNLSFS